MNYDSYWTTIKSSPEIKDVMEKWKQAKEEVKKSDAAKAYNGMFADAMSIFDDVFGPVSESEKTSLKGFSEKTGKIEVPLAGYNRADIDVSFKNNVLTVTNINDHKNEKKLQYRIPGEVENINLSMKDGLLTVVVERPKTGTTIVWVG